MTEYQISREKKPVDFNELFSKEELTSMPVGKCIQSNDGKIFACRTGEEDWAVDSDTDKFKGRMFIKIK